MKQNEENIENLIEKYGNQQPFKVPDNYFETFAERLQVRIGEEEQSHKKRSLFIYLKPALTLAASIAVIGLLVYVPIKKYFPQSEGYASQQQSVKTDTDSQESVRVPLDLISYFTEGQFLYAVTEMKAFEADTLSTESLGEFIAANYSDFEIIANN